MLAAPSPHVPYVLTWNFKANSYFLRRQTTDRKLIEKSNRSFLSPFISVCC